MLQARKQHIPKGKGVQTSSVSANSESPRTPCGSRPSKPSGCESHNMSAAARAADMFILHHVFMLIFIALWTVIPHYGTILMPSLCYFTRFT